MIWLPVDWWQMKQTVENVICRIIAVDFAEHTNSTNLSWLCIFPVYHLSLRRCKTNLTCKLVWLIWFYQFISVQPLLLHWTHCLLFEDLILKIIIINTVVMCWQIPVMVGINSRSTSECSCVHLLWVPWFIQSIWKESVKKTIIYRLMWRWSHGCTRKYMNVKPEMSEHTYSYFQKHKEGRLLYLSPNLWVCPYSAWLGAVSELSGWDEVGIALRPSERLLFNAYSDNWRLLAE